MLKGLLTPILKDDVNFINSPLIASKRGIKVIESKTTTSDDFTSLISLKVKSMEGENIVSGTIFGRTMPRILRINEFYLEAIPEGHNLLIHNLDVPGMIGQIATVMGKQGINISRMAVSQQKAEKQNVILLATDATISDEILEDLRNLENIFSVRRIEL
jgi:D-3-phosphoglycerate dehydrogenase